jgi:S-adenosylhomocysteine hydrolase
LGATVVATGNFGTTQGDVAGALNSLGIKTYGRRDDTRSEHMKNIGSVLSHGPSLFLDNGADLTKMAVRDSRFSIKDVLGGTEETTSGGFRMREEIDVPTIKQQAVSFEELESGITSYEIRNKKRITLLCDGRMFNLGGREPKGNTLECMDMGFSLQALSLQHIVKSRDSLVPGPQPVPAAINKETATRMLATMQSPQ